MFTGIVTATGRIVSNAPAGKNVQRLVVETLMPLADAALGASIAVNGVCLTLVSRRRHRAARGGGPAYVFEADLGPETLALTTLGGLVAGDLVHLERPLGVGGEFGGHLVTGHVDTQGTVVGLNWHGNGPAAALDLTIHVPAPYDRHLVPKGSIAVDGVSLTVNQVRTARKGGRRGASAAPGCEVTMTLIPHTLAVTHLGRRKVGAHVNIETDLIAKQVERMIGLMYPAPPKRKRRTRQ